MIAFILIFTTFGNADSETAVAYRQPIGGTCRQNYQCENGWCNGATCMDFIENGKSCPANLRHKLPCNYGEFCRRKSPDNYICASPGVPDCTVVWQPVGLGSCTTRGEPMVGAYLPEFCYEDCKALCQMITGPDGCKAFSTQRNMVGGRCEFYGTEGFVKYMLTRVDKGQTWTRLPEDEYTGLGVADGANGRTSISCFRRKVNPCCGLGDCQFGFFWTDKATGTCSCNCDQGYMGPHCRKDDPKELCTDSTCRNGGMCNTVSDGEGNLKKECTCPPGYSGRFCHLTPCSRYDCGMGNCSPTLDGKAQCHCFSSYILDDTNKCVKDCPEGTIWLHYQCRLVNDLAANEMLRLGVANLGLVVLCSAFALLFAYGARKVLCKKGEFTRISDGGVAEI